MVEVLEGEPFHSVLSLLSEVETDDEGPETSDVEKKDLSKSGMVMVTS